MAYSRSRILSDFDHPSANAQAGRRRLRGRASSDPSATFLQHQTVLRKVAMQLCGDPTDASDLVQDTFERVFRTTDPRALQNPRAWLITIMRNLYLDQWRRQRRRPCLVSIDEQADVAEPEPEPEPEPDWMSISTAQLQAALSRLDSRFRRVYELHNFAGASYDEIARELGISKSTVGSRLSRARHKIRRLLGAQLEARGTFHSEDHDDAL